MLHKYAHAMEFSPGLTPWQQRLRHSGFFLAALLFHLVLFLMVATWVIFKAPVTETDSGDFLRVAIRPPVPPAPPPPSGGAAANSMEPAVQNAPPPAMPTFVTTSNISTFNIATVKVAIPNLPASMTAPIGAEMSGHETPGLDGGAGNPFGSVNSTGSPQLQGFLYDLKQTQDHQTTHMSPGAYHKKISEFIDDRWDPGIFSTYYKSPRALNTPSIFIPTIKAVDGPKAFGVQDEVQPNMYVVWYKVTASPLQTGTYHFVGIADDIMLVRVNGITVLDASDRPVDDELRSKEKTYDTTNFTPTWEGDSKAWVGLPCQASTGDPVDIEVIIGEEPGGKSNYFLYIQREESTYQKQANGAPLLPVFQLDAQCIHPTAEPQTFPPFSTCAEPWQATNKM